MIKLEDSIEINVSLEALYGWLLNLDQNFVPWSPYHTSFEKVTGGRDEGDKIRFG